MEFIAAIERGVFTEHITLLSIVNERKATEIKINDVITAQQH